MTDLAYVDVRLILAKIAGLERDLVLDVHLAGRRDGRSAFIRDALRVYLRVRERARIDDQIRAAYGGRASAMLREVESLLGSQSWPDE